ncbi:MAG: hypothetical protein A2Z75_05295 [Chloroflexi bacterium RBG_13_50_10]|nr:MAG: hypothetical protein A2Z75_05295 [Chloroflexi bacterium RBG_13_50_10]
MLVGIGVGVGVEAGDWFTLPEPQPIRRTRSRSVSRIAKGLKADLKLKINGLTFSDTLCSIVETFYRLLRLESMHIHFLSHSALIVLLVASKLAITSHHLYYMRHGVV